MPKAPETVAITGASSGLGAALAESYAQPGAHLFFCARNAMRLENVAEICRNKGAVVDVALVDLRQPVEIKAWVDGIENQRSVDLMIVNAGLFGGRTHPDDMEPAEVTVALVETNLTGAILCATAAARHMRMRHAGRIALVSSLAAKLPSPDAPSYSASKAGLTVFGAALREDLAVHGVKVSVIHPGHIETAQTDQQQGLVPHVITPRQAADHIRIQLEHGAGIIDFPTVPRLWVRAMAVLPWWLRARLNRAHRFTVTNGLPDDRDYSGR